MKEDIVETTATEVEKSPEQTLLDTLKEQGTQCVLVTVNEKGVHLYKNADVPQVLGLLATATTMTNLELTKGMSPMGAPMMPQQSAPMNS